MEYNILYLIYLCNQNYLLIIKELGEKNSDMYCICSNRDGVQTIFVFNVQTILGTVYSMFRLFLAQCIQCSDNFWDSVFNVQTIFGTVYSMFRLFLAQCIQCLLKRPKSTTSEVNSKIKWLKIQSHFNVFNITTFFVECKVMNNLNNRNNW